jgi:hypothetical protein
MNFVTRIATVVTLLFASSAFAAAPNATSDDVRVVALADSGAAHATRQETLEAYAGCYAVQDGEAFVIARDEDRLTLEAPEAWGLRPLTLRAVDASTFVAVEAAVRIEFRRDAAGSVVGALLSRDDGQMVAGVRTEWRGLVTIEDLRYSAKAVRGIVTIYDAPAGSSAPDIFKAAASRTF